MTVLFLLQLRVLDYGELTVNIGRGPGTNPLWIPRDNLSFGGVRSDMQIFDSVGTCGPSVHIVYR